MSSLIKNILIVLGLIVTAALGYYLFVIEQGAVISGNERVTAQAEIETQEFLQRLNELKNISLSDSLFADQRFRSLIDNSRPVPTLPIGKQNPFQD